jgi:TolA-binding protein
MVKCLVSIALTATVLSSCSTFSWTQASKDDHSEGQSILEGDKDEAATTRQARDHAALKVATSDQLELQIARLTLRIDELEAELNKQKERGKLIEKSLLLGLIPDELRSDGPAKAVASEHVPFHEPKSQQQLSAVKLLEVKAPLEAKTEGSQDRGLYRKMIEAAQDKFNRANYGQAITAYNEVGAKFDDSVTEGSQHYWIGLSWYYLKEYKLAEESFETLQARFPASPWVAHAGFYLAKVDQSRGFRQRALERLQSILDHNPSGDLGEMAQAEIERMKEKL